MPRKGKRSKQLSCARDAKRIKDHSQATLQGDLAELEFSTCSFSDYNSESDENFDPEHEVLDEDEQIKKHATEWVLTLSRDDLMSFCVVLFYILGQLLKMGVVDAAKIISIATGKSERTIRGWRATFLVNDGTFPESLTGKYIRSGVLWQNENLNKQATKYVRENNAVKGKPNMTLYTFCHWVNETLLQNSVLVPGYPRRIGLETARKWLHELGFSKISVKKGTYIDGHEREDVVEYRNKFLRKMVSLGFLNKENAPTPEAAQALPSDLEAPASDQINKTIIFFHDESTFQACDYERTQWGKRDDHMLVPKSKGAGIMVSDFISEQKGYLRLTDEEYERAKIRYPELTQQNARKFLEYGESKEGYWTSEKFMNQIKESAKLAEYKYPKEDGYKIVWVFDHSSCHGAYSEDSLNAYKMNAKPGGKQPKMRDTVWQGKVQRMVFNIGIPKGLIQVLTERGKYHKGMKLEEMRAEIASHTDFKEEKTKIEHFLNDFGHICMFLPKFHCELNPIERCWAQAKRFTRANTNYTIQRLRTNVPLALDSVTTENIQNYFRKVRHYMFAYLQGYAGGIELEKEVKRIKKIFKSHRKVSQSN